MRIHSLLIYAMVLLLSLCFECNDSHDSCVDAEAPEINFGLLLGGEITFKNSSGVTIASEHEEMRMDVYKVYCDGTENGPFATEFTIAEDGVLVKKGISYMSYRMDNTLDYMRIVLFIDNLHAPKGFNTFGEPCAIWYDKIKSQDGGNAYIHFTLTEMDISRTYTYTIN